LTHSGVGDFGLVANLFSPNFCAASKQQSPKKVQARSHRHKRASVTSSVFLESISTIFYKQLFRRHSFTKKFKHKQWVQKSAMKTVSYEKAAFSHIFFHQKRQTQILIKEMLRKTLLNNMSVHKKLLKLTPLDNFNNILQQLLPLIFFWQKYYPIN